MKPYGHFFLAESFFFSIFSYIIAYHICTIFISETSFNEPDASEISIDSAEMSYGSANQLTDFNGTPIVYDADGNALSTPLGDAWRALTYNSEKCFS